MPVIRVTSIAEYATALADIPLARGRTRFFRGHSDYKNYKLEPSVFRKPNLIENEESLIQEAKIRCPSDLPSSLSFIEALVRLQHYGLPTRLLDLTANSLVALYFACKHKEKTEGEVIVLDIPDNQIKFHDSDTVAILANIARRPKAFNVYTLPADRDKFNEDPQVGRLLHDIRNDKPAFRNIIEPSDLRRVVAVRTRLDNARIARQEGAFLLFGADGSKLKPAKVPDGWLVCGTDDRRIIFSNKHKLKRELLSFGVSEQSLFPELESQAAAIVARYQNKYARKKKVI
ncbi:MAG TPA: FRG domain-containing protein [Ottowia sp.]|uniref:FRG domain-containing protein n=1 Tax=Ottowia sp. TaxID=1898956 RepID=UPI002CAAF4A1|nr:FRG domain-containing protein [Ottowia sp.]HMN22550.1 FRG domain-containing protein [Ottowia sp.]